MRSLLFVPGDDERKLARALDAEADALVLDLEDSVAPEKKDRARALVRAFLTDPASRRGGALRFVRVNALGSGLVDDDLEATLAGRPDGVMLPKAEGGRDVQALGARLAVRESEEGIADGATRIVAIATETAAAMFGMQGYRGCSARLLGLAWGAEDLGADLCAERRRDRHGQLTDAFRLARTLTLLAARAAGIEPIDGIHADFRDIEGLKREAQEACADGFTAKMAIHPAQVEPINLAMTPSTDALERARAIVAAFERHAGRGAVALDGVMIDRPHLEEARRLLARSIAPSASVRR